MYSWTALFAIKIGDACVTGLDLSGLAIRLRIEHLIVIDDGGQKSSLCEIRIDNRRFLGCDGAGENRFILLRSMNRFRKRDDRRAGWFRFLRCGCRGETTQPNEGDGSRGTSEQARSIMRMH